MSNQVSFADVNTYARIQVGRQQDRQATTSPATTTAVRYGMVFQHLPRCQKCGRFLKPTAPTCTNQKCKLEGQRQQEPIKWPPEGIKFTNDPSKVGQLVNTAPPTPDPAEVLASLDKTIRGTAYNWARKTPDGALDTEDFAQEIRAAILQKAEQDPNFLEQEPSYIVAHGAWRAMDEARHQLCYNAPADEAEFEDRVRGVADAMHPRFEAGLILGEIWEFVVGSAESAESTDNWKRIIEVILTEEDVFFSTTQRLNVTAVARALSVDKKTVNQHLEGLKAALSLKGLGLECLGAAA